MKLLRKVLSLIRHTRFKASKEKAQLVQIEVKYLSLGINSRMPDFQRVEVLSKLPVPKDVPSLRGLLDIVNFFRTFNESLADKG